MDAWRKYRAEFEAYLPDADGKTADEIAEIRDGRRSFMDLAEEHYAAKSDSELMGAAEDFWVILYVVPCFGSSDYYHCSAIEAVLDSRGYDVDGIRDRFRAQAAAKTKADCDAMLAAGGRRAQIAREALSLATDVATGQIDWSGFIQSLWAASDGRPPR
jgi:hypothetical protein